MYLYSVTNYKTVAVHLIIIKETLTKGLIKYRCPLGNYDGRETQNKSDQTAL
jgi:hypothetical protein